MSNFDLVLKLFFQLGIILLTCRLVTFLGVKYFKQTPVVCEMVAGVLLGPSLLGLFFPNIQQWLFPTTQLTLADGRTISNQSMTILFAFSQVGVALYMFIVGLEFNTELIKKYFKSASTILFAGILIPFTLGFITGYYLHEYNLFFGKNISLFHAMLFLGASLSITAFPMLARILYENKIAHTRLGTLTLAAGSMDDAMAWCLLAIILAILNDSFIIALSAIVGGALYVILMLTIGKPILLKLITFFNNGHDNLHISTLVIVLSVVMFCAWFTDFCGIYAIFGAFVAGVAMPRNKLMKELKTKIEYLTSAFLLPTFFVFSGLNTQIALINSTSLFLITLLIILLSILGKGFGCTMAAKLSGESWNDSLIIGTLMNARGLMELIIINIGLAYGIITPTLFTILVLMAIITTLITSPLYYLLLQKRKTALE